MTVLSSQGQLWKESELSVEVGGLEEKNEQSDQARNGLTSVMFVSEHALSATLHQTCTTCRHVTARTLHPLPLHSCLITDSHLVPQSDSPPKPLVLLSVLLCHGARRCPTSAGLARVSFSLAVLLALLERVPDRGRAAV
jgi:hypothetical protein